MAGLIRQPPPNTLEISLEGDETLRYPLLGIHIQRVGTTTQFTLPFVPGSDDTEVVDVETAKQLVGDDLTIKFVEVQGFEDEGIGLTGDDLATAYPGTHSASGQPIVTLIFKDRGARIFGELTGKIAGSEEDQIAIFLDEQQLVSPRVTTAITAGSATTLLFREYETWLYF
jgi:preprotein translocase subunit SecD